MFDVDFVIVRMLSAAPYDANVRYRAVMLLAKPNFILVWIEGVVVLDIV